MQFQSKDLMISVAPESLARACLLRTTICYWPTYCRYFTCNVYSGGCGISCQYVFSHLTCRYGTILTDPCGVISPVVQLPQGYDPIAIRDVGEIKALRVELEETLRRLGEVEKEGRLPVASGASVDQLRDLEAKTKEALTEIQAEIKRQSR